MGPRAWPLVLMLAAFCTGGPALASDSNEEGAPERDGSATTGNVDPQSLEALARELAAEKKRLAEQARLLEEQMAANREQAKKLAEMEKRLEAALAGVGATAPKKPDDGLEAALASAAQPSENDLGWIQGEREELYRSLEETGFVKSVPLFGSDWRFSIGGYVKLDLIADLDGTGDRYQFTTSTIPVDGAPGPQPGSYVNIHARETRFSFDLRNMREDLPPNQAFLEMDFFSGDRPPYSNNPRLRHAYLRFGNLIAGRTWSTLTDLRTLPYIIDFAYGDALYGGRTALIRWEQPLGDQWKASVGIEMLEESGIENPYGLPGTARPNLPLFALRGDYEWADGSISFGGSMAQLRWDGADGVGDDDALQYDLVLGARVFLDAKHRTYAGLAGSWGCGSGGNIVAFIGQEANAVLRQDGTLDTMQAWNLSLAFHHAWSEKFSSNLAFATAWIKPSRWRTDDAIKTVAAAHVNLIWEPFPEFRTGIEFMIGRRENTDGKDGTARRIQFMTMFSF